MKLIDVALALLLALLFCHLLRDADAIEHSDHHGAVTMMTGLQHTPTDQSNQDGTELENSGNASQREEQKHIASVEADKLQQNRTCLKCEAVSCEEEIKPTDAPSSSVKIFITYINLAWVLITYCFN